MDVSHYNLGKFAPTILVVDDEKTIRELLCTSLKCMGCRQVMSAEDGFTALKIYQTFFAKIDLVLMDLLMPGINGWEVLKAMKIINRDIKVIIISGYTGINDLLKDFDNINGLLHKPFTMKQLSKVIGQALSCQQPLSSGFERTDDGCGMSVYYY